MRKPIEKSLEDRIIAFCKKHKKPKRVHDFRKSLKITLNKLKELSDTLEKMVADGKMYSRKSEYESYRGQPVFFLEKEEEKAKQENLVPSRESMPFKPFNQGYYANVMEIINERRLS